MSDIKSFISEYKKRIFGIAALLLVSALLLFQGLAGSVYSFRDNERVEEYNAAVESLQDETLSLEDWIGAFQKVERLSDPESFVSVASKYNLSYLMVSQSVGDIEVLRIARQLLVEALRLEPEDKDIRKNLELVTSVLIEEVKEQLMKEGMSEEEANEIAVEQETGDIPSSGPDPSGDSRGNDDF